MRAFCSVRVSPRWRGSGSSGWALTRYARTESRGEGRSVALRDGTQTFKNSVQWGHDPDRLATMNYVSEEEFRKVMAPLTEALGEYAHAGACRRVCVSGVI